LKRFNICCTDSFPRGLTLTNQNSYADTGLTIQHRSRDRPSPAIR